MRRDDLNDLTAFAAVAEVGSFTKAAGRSGLSQSALSRAVRNLEDRHGVALLIRSTRKVALTDAGESLLATVQPALQAMEDELEALERWRDRPADRLRLATTFAGALTILGPTLRSFLLANPQVELEFHTQETVADLVSGRYDAGIRPTTEVPKDAIAVPVGKEVRPMVVAAPEYLTKYPPPKNPEDLSRHRCIGFRIPEGGPVKGWSFERAGEVLEISVNGGPIFNDRSLIEMAALGGLGLAQLSEAQVAGHVRAGRLQQVLEPFSAPSYRHHLYYSGRRNMRPALRQLIEALTEDAD